MKKISFILLTFLTSYFYCQQQQIGFLENKGQIRNQDKKQDSSVLFLFPSSQNYNVQLKREGFSYDFYKYFEDTTEFKSGKENYKNQRINTHRLDVHFLGSDPSVIPSASNVYSDYFNFAQNLDSFAFYHHVNHFQTVKYENLYPNIDLQFKIINNKVKYDFIVKPSGKIEDIKLSFSGHTGFAFMDSVLQFDFSFGQNFEKIPLSYYNDTSNLVSIRYEIIDSANNVISIGFKFANISDLDISKTLIIDPEPDLYWGNYTGNSFFNSNSSVITNKNGEVIFGGTSVNLMTYASSGFNQNSLKNESYDAFYSKLDKKGNLQWTTFYQGNHIEIGETVQVDTMLNYYLIGTTLTMDSLQADSSFLNKQIFVLKSKKDGSLGYFKLLNSSANEYGANAIVDFPGNLYLASTYDSIFSQDSIEQNVHIRKLDLNGDLLWSQRILGNKNDLATGISFGNNRVVICGNTNSTSGIASIGSFKDSLSGVQDGFLTSFNAATGNNLWSSYFGGENIDAFGGLKAFNEDIFVIGKTNSKFIISDTATAFQDSLAGDFDALMVNFDTNGNLLWSTYLGGSNYDEALSISRELDSNIFILGKTFSSDSIAFGNVYQKNLAGSSDCFISKFSKYGERIWTSYYGGTDVENPKSIHVFGNTSIYVCGETRSMSLIVDSVRKRFGNDYSGNTDGFMSKFTQDKSTIFFSDTTASGPGGPFSGGCSGGGSGNNGFRDYLCLGDTLFLNFTNGELGTDAQWVWYLDGCGDAAPQIGVGESIVYVPANSVRIFVRAESISNATDCVSNYFNVAPRPIAVIYTDSIFCIGSLENLRTNTNDSIIWSFNNAFLSNNQDILIQNSSLANNGNYQVKVYNQFGCSDSTSLNISVNESPTATYTLIDEKCQNSNDGSIQVSLYNPSDSIIWQNYAPQDPQNLDSLNSGIYIVKITNNFKCELLDTLEIKSFQNLTFDSIISPVNCGFYDGSISILPTVSDSTIQYSWSNGSNSRQINSLKSGDYHLQIVDSNQCSYFFDFNLIPQGNLFFEVNPIDTTIYKGDSVLIQISSLIQDSSITYTWSDSTSLNCQNCLTNFAFPIENTLYTISASTNNFCVGERQFYIQVMDTSSLPGDTLGGGGSTGCGEVFIPDHFSPNGDLINDTWCVYGNCIKHRNIQVFNQFNQLIFESNSQNDCWDGKYKGEFVQEDSYFYRVHLVTTNEGVLHLSGVVYLKY